MNVSVQGLSDEALEGALAQLRRQPGTWTSRLNELLDEVNRRKSKRRGKAVA